MDIKNRLWIAEKYKNFEKEKNRGQPQLLYEPQNEKIEYPKMDYNMDIKNGLQYGY